MWSIWEWETKLEKWEPEVGKVISGLTVKNGYPET